MNNPNSVGIVNCPLCFEVATGDVFAHQNGGEEHPMHVKCLKQWLQTQSFCPVCEISFEHLKGKLLPVRNLSEESQKARRIYIELLYRAQANLTALIQAEQAALVSFRRELDACHEANQSNQKTFTRNIETATTNLELMERNVKEWRAKCDDPTSIENSMCTIAQIRQEFQTQYRECLERRTKINDLERAYRIREKKIKEMQNNTDKIEKTIDRILNLPEGFNIEIRMPCIYLVKREDGRIVEEKLLLSLREPADQARSEPPIARQAPSREQPPLRLERVVRRESAAAHPEAAAPRPIADQNPRIAPAKEDLCERTMLGILTLAIFLVWMSYNYMNMHKNK